MKRKTRSSVAAGKLQETDHEDEDQSEVSEELLESEEQQQKEEETVENENDDVTDEAEVTENEEEVKEDTGEDHEEGIEETDIHDRGDEEVIEPLPDEEDDVNDDNIEGVVENPLFEPGDSAEPAPIQSFSMDAVNDDDLDFEPDTDETVKKPEEEADNINWMQNIASPGKVVDDDTTADDINNTVETVDEVVISDTDDIDELGDKIDAAYPGGKAKVMIN